MRRLAPTFMLSGILAALACGVPTAAALPQQMPSIPWTYVSRFGDTVAGRVGVVIDTVTPRQIVKRDTLWLPVAADTAPRRTGVPFGSWECTAPGAVAPFNLCV